MPPLPAFASSAVCPGPRAQIETKSSSSRSVGIQQEEVLAGEEQQVAFFSPTPMRFLFRRPYVTPSFFQWSLLDALLGRWSSR